MLYFKTKVQEHSVASVSRFTVNRLINWHRNHLSVRRSDSIIILRVFVIDGDGKWMIQTISNLFSHFPIILV